MNSQHLYRHPLPGTSEDEPWAPLATGARTGWRMGCPEYGSHPDAGASFQLPQGREVDGCRHVVDAGQQMVQGAAPAEGRLSSHGPDVRECFHPFRPHDPG